MDGFSLGKLSWLFSENDNLLQQVYYKNWQFFKWNHEVKATRKEFNLNTTCESRPLQKECQNFAKYE